MDPVRAAGGAVWHRDGDGVIRVLLVHRPRYDDWTLPKGKADPGESDLDTAIREVEEETGLRAAVGAELPAVRYEDHKGRDKVVRYWAMELTGADPAGPDSGPSFVPNDEVDSVRWCNVETARTLLSYARDRAVVDSLVSVAACGGSRSDGGDVT